MEALIFGLVIMAVGAFFNKEKKKTTNDDNLPAKPVSANTSTSRDGRSGQYTFKRVEDYAREIYGELQTQKTQGSGRVEQVKQKAEEVIERAPLREAREEVARRVSTRESRHEIQDEIQDRFSSSKPRSIRNQPVVQNMEESSDELLPLETEDIRRGIIMAEILLPPKSKR
ncbi:hypothetical protein [Planococcus versutus]|uniref:Uncharacterized protein n=1 Tax=Planococcus versutus TaxID=1302659 RepID=A0A1B1RXA3_9BACL|nr:hypothetical protein [Planococcus versutus]ANU25564.1 hypothetical protein I858_000540 [Planococcus versutus]